MAEGESGQERTEQPTSKRLEEARKEGNVPRSTDFNAAAVMLLAGAGLYMMGGRLGTQLYELMRAGLSLKREESVDESRALAMFANEALHALLACAPILGLTLVAAVLAPMAIGGWNLSFTALAPKLDKLNPANGLERMFSARSAVELAKALAKFLFIALVAVCLLWKNSGELMGLGAEPVASGLAHAAHLDQVGALGAGIDRRDHGRVS